MRIIESIGSWGVRSSDPSRIGIVSHGDIVMVPENLRRYPSRAVYSRIGHVRNGIAHICEDMGSAFLLEDGSCSISGGPFWSVPIEFLKPTGTLKTASYWNWGDNLPGDGMGVRYNLEKPVHELLVHPDNVTTRFGRNEETARLSLYSVHGNLGPEWKLIRKFDDIETSSEFGFIFHRTLA